MKRDSDGVPYIEITLNGKTAKISPLTVKRTLLDQGIVSLGAEFEDDLPPISLTTNGGIILLYGCTNDPAIVQQVRDFIQQIGG